MENSKANGAGEKPSEPNPNPNPNPSTGNSDDSAAVAAAAEGDEPTRRPFTALSQVDADLALARVLQEQERAYMMLRMGGDGSEYSSEAGSYDEYEEEEEEFEGEEEGINHDHLIDEGDDMDGSYYDEDAFDANNNQEVAIGEFEDDEAFARALQDAEEREVAVRLMQLAGLSEWRAVEPEDHGSHSQDAWQEVDPDEYSYEELIAIGEVVGTESRGASADTIASLPSVNYKSQNIEGDNAEQCVVCRVEFEEDESLSILPCKHMYHPECISKWLQINKACPMCSKEVSTSGDSKQD